MIFDLRYISGRYEVVNVCLLYYIASINKSHKNHRLYYWYGFFYYYVLVVQDVFTVYSYISRYERRIYGLVSIRLSVLTNWDISCRVVNVIYYIYYYIIGGGGPNIICFICPYIFHGNFDFSL